MNDLLKRLTFVLLVLSVIFSGFSQETIQAKVVLPDGEPAGEVTIYFSNVERPFFSESDGSFQVPASVNTEGVTIIKRGFELSGTVLSNNELTITIRKATIKRITGQLLTRSRKPISGKEVALAAARPLKTTTDNSGRFSFKIPYEEQIDVSSTIDVTGTEFEVDKVDELLDKGEITVVLLASIPGEEIQVTVQTADGDPLRNALVMVNNNPFVTNSQGIFFAAPSVIFSESAVQVDGHVVSSIDTSSDGKNIAISVGTGRTPTAAADPVAAASISDDSLLVSLITQGDTAMFSGQKLSNRIDSLVEYYTIQQSRFKEQNKRIIDIRDSLSYLSDLSDDEQQKLFDQVVAFDQSINLLDSVFQDTKTNSLELILLLRERLKQQEQEIKDIEEEKNKIAETFRKNVKTFLAIIIGFIFLLVIAMWIIRRFSIQKRVIETTKKQLVHAQSMAKIGSMAYNFKNEVYDFSDYFFETLRVPSKITGEMLRESRKDVFDMLVSEKDQVRVRQAWNTSFNNKKPLKVEFQGITEDDSIIYMDMNTRFGVSETNQIEAISTTVQDITEKKKHELRLLEAVEKAEEAAKVKDQFLSSMSHEIRTPLNAIIGMADFMLGDQPKKEHIPKLNTLHFSGQHLLALVNDILDFSKIKSGRLRVEVSDFALEPLLQNIMLTLSFSVKEKGIQLYYLVDPDVPSFISGDKLKVNQVLINLVGNAIKFTEKGEVKVTVSKREEMLVFSVSDTGIGIAKDKLEKIFIGFEQENVSTARKYGGTGLGLSISRELSQLLGGGLEVDSELGKGSVFSFSIPLIEVKDRDEEDTVTEFLDDSNILKGLRVLCVEDNEINQIVIEQYFDKWGIKSTFADNGEQAIKEAKEKEFDLIFMDIRLPDMSGYEITAAILESDEHFSTPIVALTAEIDDMTEMKIKESGMVGFLGKPFKPEELREALLLHTDDTYQDLTDEEKELRRKQIEKSKKHLAEVEEAASEDQEISIETLKEHTQTKEALDFFVNAFGIRMDEFKIAYENAIYNKDIDELDNITHTILPHLKLLGMNKMQKFIKTYTDMDLDDQERVKEVIDKLEDYRVLIKETLAEVDV